MWRNVLILAVTIVLGAGATYLLDYSFSPVSEGTLEAEQAGYVKGETVPDFTFTDLNGNARNISDFKGKIVVLNFWATWCAPCVKEMPLFLDMAKEYPEQVVFLGLSNDFKQEKIQDFLDNMEEQKPGIIAQDNVIFSFDENGSITREVFQTYRLPETIIIDTSGVMRDRLVGAEWSYDDLLKIIEKY